MILKRGKKIQRRILGNQKQDGQILRVKQNCDKNEELFQNL